MPDYSYHCVNCGALLTPEDIVYDISGIAFFGALSGDYSQFPIYATKAKMETLFAWSDGRGKSSISLQDWITMLYEQCGDQLDPTRAKDAKDAYDKYKALLKEQLAQQNDGVGYYQNAVIPGLPDNLSRVLVNNCGKEEVSHCVIELSDSYGYIVLDGPDYVDWRRCKSCHSTILKHAFECQQTLIGLIGFQKVGKTCLIAALCEYLRVHAPGSRLLLRPCDKSFDRERLRYANGFPLKKTTPDGQTTINPTIYIKYESRPAIMLTFVDIAGEAFNNKDGEFDPSMMENNFRAIKECSLFIYCTTLAAFEMDDFKKMEDSFDTFKRHIENNGDQRKLSPMLVAVMQIDDPLSSGIDEKKPPYVSDEYLYQREYEQIRKIADSKQFKSIAINDRYRDDIMMRLISFLDCVKGMTYFTPITCSAYGKPPVEQIVVYRDSPSIRQAIEAFIRLERPTQIVIRDASKNQNTNGETLFESYQAKYGQNSSLVEVVDREMDERETQQYWDALSQENDKEIYNLNWRFQSKDEDIVRNSPLKFTPEPRNMSYIYEWIMRMIGEMDIPSRTKSKVPIPEMDCRQLRLNDVHTDDNEIQAIARMFANPNDSDRNLYGCIQDSRGLFKVIKKNYYLAKAEHAKRDSSQKTQ